MTLHSKTVLVILAIDGDETAHATKAHRATKTKRNRRLKPCCFSPTVQTNENCVAGRNFILACDAINRVP